MFERKKPTPPQKRIDSLIGAGTTVHGDVNFKGGLRIDGTVEGNVLAADGEIRVSHVVINGTVRGPVVADGYLELQPKARVVGDVTYKTLEMHVGSVIEGRLNHAEPGGASVVELKRAASE